MCKIKDPRGPSESGFNPIQFICPGILQLMQLEKSLGEQTKLKVQI